MTGVPTKDSDQPGHSPSLIRVFAIRMKKAPTFGLHISIYIEESVSKVVMSVFLNTPPDILHFRSVKNTIILSIY